MSWQTELLYAIAVSSAYIIIFCVAEIWRKFGKPLQEQTRKMVHFTTGSMCLSFTHIFQSHWTVLALCISFLVIMIGTKKKWFIKFNS